MEYVWNVQRRLFFQGTPLARSTLGSPETVASISLEDAVAFKDAYFSAGNLNYIAAGDIELDELNEALQKSVVLPADSTKKPTSEPLPIIRNTSVDVELYDIDNACIIAGFRTGILTLAEIAALDIASMHLTQGRSSELQKELRYKRGLVYVLGGGFKVSDDWGTWIIRTACSPNKLQLVLDIIGDAVSKLRSIELETNILESLKTRAIKSAVIRLQTSRSWVEQCEDGLLRSKDSYTLDKYAEALNQLTPNDVLTAAKKHLKPEAYYVALCGPKSCESVKIS